METKEPSSSSSSAAAPTAQFLVSLTAEAERRLDVKAKEKRQQQANADIVARDLVPEFNKGLLDLSSKLNQFPDQDIYNGAFCFTFAVPESVLQSDAGKEVFSSCKYDPNRSGFNYTIRSFLDQALQKATGLEVSECRTDGWKRLQVKIVCPPAGCNSARARLITGVTTNICPKKCDNGCEICQ